MYKVAAKLVCVLLMGESSVPPSWAGQHDKQIAEEAARVEMQVIEWRRTFHQNPESANEEFETARVIAEHLQGLGLQHVVTGVARTGVVGILEGQRPGATVALRADMDAVSGVEERSNLPFKSARKGVGHLCGHDGHSAMLMGVATVLSRMRDQLAGSVMFIFQPAEEGILGDGLGPDEFGGSEGARLMLEEGIFTDSFLGGKYRPSVVFGQHILPRDAGEVSYVAGSRLFSSDWFKITVVEAASTFSEDRGRGIGPYLGMAGLIDALSRFPAEPATLEVPYPSKLGIVSVHTLSQEGDPTRKRGVEVIARLGTSTNEAREDGIAWIQNTARSVAQHSGTEISVTVSGYAPPVINNGDLVKMLRPSMVNAVGEENLNERPFIPPAADDVAIFMQQVPGIFVFLGANREGVKTGEAPYSHSPDFFVNEGVLKTGVKVLSTLTVDYLAAAVRNGL